MKFYYLTKTDPNLAAQSVCPLIHRLAYTVFVITNASSHFRLSIITAANWKSCYSDHLRRCCLLKIAAKRLVLCTLPAVCIEI